MAQYLTADKFLELSEIDLLYMVALRRLPFAEEIKATDTLQSIRLRLRSLHEFVQMNPPLEVFTSSERDIKIELNTELIKRIFHVILDRSPSSEEIKDRSMKDYLSLSETATSLLFSVEAYKTDKLQDQNGSLEHSLQREQLIASYGQFDVYARRVNERIRSNIDGTRKRASDLSNNLKVGLCLFDMSSVDKQAIISHIAPSEIQNKISIKTINPIDINKDSLDGFDLFITNNNFLYKDYGRITEVLKSSSCLSVCWHWDNHHMFEMNGMLVNSFDYIFPAHSNGSIALHDGTAILGQVVPCCVFQWSVDEAAEYFQKVSEGVRSDNLYGRFNSYPGRVGLRDIFLRDVKKSIINNSVDVITYYENGWLNQSKLDRFEALAKYKIVLCNPIYNDVPARLYDALLVGAIPIIPYGLPDLDIAFNYQNQTSLPVIKYLPDSIVSLQSACREAIQVFNSMGVEGVLKRNSLVVNNHMLIHRIARIINEVYDCENIMKKTL